jgi:PIN domain nuclease of toxin-antitoxin system
VTSVLLDTDVLLLFVFEPDRIAPVHRSTFTAADRYVSQICAIEMALKSASANCPCRRRFRPISPALSPAWSTTSAPTSCLSN